MIAKLDGLSGYIPVRDGDLLDYCWREASMSLLPIVDELILIDSGSTDGSRKEMDDWAKVNSKISVIDYPWPKLPTPEEVESDDLKRPPCDPRMLLAWLDFGRRACSFRFQITLDADEVLSPQAYPEIRRAMNDGIPRWFNRVNFWGDPFHEAPHGSVCGERVARFAPTDLEMCSDEPRPEGEPEIRKLAISGPDLKIFHLGFLRRQDAFLKKSRRMQGYLHGCYDPRLREAEKTGESWVKLSPFPAGWSMIDYPHRDWPDYVNAWLKERGYAV